MRSVERIGIVVQARLGSSRLPRKALIEVSGKPLLQRLCDRMRLCRHADDLVVATSNQLQDQAIEEACGAWGVHVCRGPEKDLTSRLLGVARTRGWSSLVRVTGDNPLTDPNGIDEMIDAFRESGAATAIVHNAHRKGYPYGTGAEIASRTLLETCDRELESPDDREGFMAFARQRAERFKCIKLDAPTRLLRPDYFLTVDYLEDLTLQKEIFAHFGGRHDMRLEEIIEFLDANPELPRINSHLHQQFSE
ncbi:MAG: cytidylyltransferase domain-containing protein [Candidatus Acidiferrales bacterium]